jgi:hypothetical protein
MFSNNLEKFLVLPFIRSRSILDDFPMVSRSSRLELGFISRSEVDEI